MLNVIASLLLFIAIVPAASASETVAVNAGLVTLAYQDGQRRAWDGQHPRPLLTHFFYPTHAATTPLNMGKPPLFYAGQVSWQGKPAIDGKRPLILMSHGTGGSALQMVWLAQLLARHGFLVAAVNHHGNTAIEKKQYPQAYKLWWERSRDLAVVLKKLHHDKHWAQYIDFNRVGVAGFSLGGYTALSALGGITDKGLMTAFCRSPLRDFTCQAQHEYQHIDEDFNKVKNSPQVRASMAREHRSYKIAAIKAAFVIAPAVVQAFTAASLKNITVPVSVVVGTADRVAPGKTNAHRIAELAANAHYTEINGAGHYTFLDQCAPAGRKILPMLCNDGKQVDRQQIHQHVAQQALQFFTAHL